MADKACLVWTATKCPKRRDVYFGPKTKRKIHNAMNKYNEDRIIVAPPLFVVLDGHGGRKIGVEVEKLLRKKLRAFSLRRGETEEDALIRLFGDIDRWLYDTINRLYISGDKSVNEWRSGCTCTVVILSKNGKELLCASIGDSQLFSFEYNSFTGQYMNTFYSPLDSSTDPIEIARIEAAGGKVYSTRVGGTLAISRSFGDFELEKSNKPFANKRKSYPDRMIVSAVPHVSRLPLKSADGAEVWWILASDGLWDIADSDNIALILDEIKDKHADLSYEDKMNILLRLLPETGRKRKKWIKYKKNGDPSLPVLYDEENSPSVYPHDDRSIIIFITNMSL